MILADEANNCSTFICDYIHTQFDPAHVLSELGFTIVFDLLLVFLVWGKLIKPYINRKLEQQHKELDNEHGVEHNKDN